MNCETILTDPEVTEVYCCVGWQLNISQHCPRDPIFWPHWFVGNKDKKAHDPLRTQYVDFERTDIAARTREKVFF